MREQLRQVRNILDFPERLGGKAAEMWLESPSPRDPNITNADALSGKLFADVYEGRPLSKRYLNPIEDACRRGLVKGAIEEMEKKIMEGVVLSELFDDVIAGRSLSRRYPNADKEALRRGLVAIAIEDLEKRIREFVASEGEISIN